MDDHNSKEKQLLTPNLDPSNRPSDRIGLDQAKEPNSRETEQPETHDSIPYTGIASQPPAEDPSNSKNRKITRQQLYRIEENMTGRDHEVLRALSKYRFLSSDQVGRLFVTDCSTKTSQTRNRNLLLKRLADYGLIRPLWRRVGGGKGGSEMQVWYLAPAGHRLLNLYQSGKAPRKAYSEPSPTFLKHTLSVAETAVQLITMCRDSEDLMLAHLETEPSCWRPFNNDGKAVQLKPDLFVITTYEEYEDRWFVEMDLGTESQTQIIGKCNAYLNYYYTGIEQRKSEMFPMVLFIAHTARRKEKIRQSIRERIKGQPKMFLVITPDELEKTMRQYTDPGEIC